MAASVLSANSLGVKFWGGAQTTAEQKRFFDVELSRFPPPPDLNRILSKDFRVSFPRELFISEPCKGLCSNDFALKALGVPYASVNKFHTHSDFVAINETAFPYQSQGTYTPSGIMLYIDVAQLRPADLLIAGLVCPPWSNCMGANDPRFAVYMRCIDWCIAQAQAGYLKAFALENVPGINNRSERLDESFIDGVVRKLRDALPFFQFKLHSVSLQDLGLPQNRTRLWLVGVRGDVLCGGDVPAPLSPLQGDSDLASYLNLSLPNLSLKSFNKETQWTIKEQLDAIKGVRKWPKWDDEKIVAVFDIHPKVGGVYSTIVYYNKVPALTTKYESLFLVSVGDLSRYKKSFEKFTIFRLLTLPERLAVSGLPPTLARVSRTKKAVLRGTADCYSPFMVASVVAPLLKLLDRSGTVKPEMVNIGEDDKEEIAVRIRYKERVKREALSDSQPGDEGGEEEELVVSEAERDPHEIYAPPRKLRKRFLSS